MAKEEHFGRSANLIDRRTIAATLVGAASIGVQVLVPLLWPELDRTIGIALLIACALALIAAIAVIVIGRTRSAALYRHWRIAGFGQGWVEALVRNNSGDQLTVSWNSGAGSDQITISVRFHQRMIPRRSHTVEAVFEVDGVVFEWDIPDRGAAEFALEGALWRDIEQIKLMLSAFRGGHNLRVVIPDFQLEAHFTLNGAFDVLDEVVTLGEG